MKSLLILISLSIATFLISCSDDEADANASLKGDWDVKKAIWVTNDGNIETQDAGYMNFSSETVEYNFTVTDSTYSGTADWELTKEMVNSGFHKVPKYTLTIGEVFTYDVLFGDGTDDSAEDATEITLTQDEEATEGYMVLNLEKR